MLAYKCKCCGSGELEPLGDGRKAQCVYCNTVMVLPTLQPETYNHANDLRLKCDFDQAVMAFERIVSENPEDSESYWNLLLSRYGIEYVETKKGSGIYTPTCHRMTYQSILEDEDYQKALKYAEEKGIPVSQSVHQPYSEDENLLHISHEAGMLEDPAKECPVEVYNRSNTPEKAPDKVTKIAITFKDGIPVKVKNLEDETVKTDSLELFTYLNELGAENGIGHLDMVENRYVGIKSRGIYETPGGTILFIAHRDIEGIAMDREVMRLRDMLSPELARLIYNGYWYSPEMDFLMAAINKSQEVIDGTVTLKLYKGNAYPIARESDSSLYDQKLSSMDEEGGYNQEDATGFIKINAVRLMAHNKIMNNKDKEPIEFTNNKK